MRYSTEGKLSYKDQCRLRAWRLHDSWCTPRRIDWLVCIAGIATVTLVVWGFQ